MDSVKSSMTKSSIGIVTRGITQLATDTLPYISITTSGYIDIHYDLWFTTENRYHPRDSNGNIFFTTTLRNVSVIRYGVPLVTILLLDFVLIHWIRHIQWNSFRKNSNVCDIKFIQNDLVNTGEKVVNLESMVSGHCTTLCEHVISMRTSYFDIDFASQMKFTKFPLIHCFEDPHALDLFSKRAHIIFCIMTSSTKRSKLPVWICYVSSLYYVMGKLSMNKVAKCFTYLY